MRTSVYLGGKMTGLSFEEMIKWRREATNILQANGFIVHDPTSNLSAHEVDDLQNAGFATPCKEVVATNTFQIKNSDILLLEFDYEELSVGTVCEVIAGAVAYNKIVVTWGKHKVLRHPWVEHHITARRDTLDKALEYIVRTYGRKN